MENRPIKMPGITTEQSARAMKWFDHANREFVTFDVRLSDSCKMEVGDEVVIRDHPRKWWQFWKPKPKVKKWIICAITENKNSATIRAYEVIQPNRIAP